MIKIKPAKKEFIELMTQNTRINGLDDITSKIIGILFAESKDISLEELSKRTGYCLSAISTKMKLVEGIGLVKRIKKPKSKKVYFFMEKDLLDYMFQIMIKKYQKILIPTKEKLPQLIKDYKTQGCSKEDLDVVKSYYSQVVEMESFMKTVVTMLEKA